MTERNVRVSGTADRYYAVAPFTGKDGKAAEEKFQRRAEEAAKNEHK
ncbi:hypothetical protein ACAG24_017625 [Mycobacterium sp. pW049]